MKRDIPGERLCIIMYGCSNNYSYLELIMHNNIIRHCGHTLTSSLQRVARVSSSGKMISYNILYDILLKFVIINCNSTPTAELYKNCTKIISLDLSSRALSHASDFHMPVLSFCN